MSVVVRADRVRRMIAKELRESLRDRNLIINIVLIPLFLYPLLGFGMFQAMLLIRGAGEREVVRVGVTPDVPAAVRDSLDAVENVDVVEMRVSSVRQFRNRREAAAAGDRAFEAALDWTKAESGADSAIVWWDSARDRSQRVRNAATEALDAWQRDKSREALTRAGLAADALDPWVVEEEDTASAEQQGRELLSVALPLILLLMMMQGTFYAALDTLVGERERGTLETLFTSGLTRAEAVLGKFLYVVVASVTALALNLASLTLFLSFALEVAGADIRVSVPASAFVVILAAAVLTAAVVASVCLLIAAPAKSFREGQAMLMPAYFAVMIPGMIVTFDRSPFGMKQALIPVMNSVALFESALSGRVPAGPTAVTFLVLAATAAIVLSVAGRAALREDTWFDPKLTLRGLLRGGRRSA